MGQDNIFFEDLIPRQRNLFDHYFKRHQDLGDKIFTRMSRVKWSKVFMENLEKLLEEVKVRASLIDFQELVVGENVRHILTKTYQRLARDHLNILGLTFCIEKINVSAPSWLALLKLTANVIECISYAPLKEDDQSLYINFKNEMPDTDGWITGIRQVEAPYWIAKTNLAKLQTLEAFLYEMTY
jgi:hypothetical protein